MLHIFLLNKSNRGTLEQAWAGNQEVADSIPTQNFFSSQLFPTTMLLIIKKSCGYIQKHTYSSLNGTVIFFCHAGSRTGALSKHCY